jgi:hypothetical protein
MTTKRIRFTLVLSCDGFPYEEAIAFLAPELGTHFAGAMFESITGVWSEDGDQWLDKHAKGHSEPGIKLTVSVLPDREDNAILQLQTLIKAMKRELALPIQWVHVEKESVDALHFLCT